MDTVTHAALGIVIGWLRRPGEGEGEAPTNRAVPWATLMAAEAPDLDVFIRRIPGLEWVGHRGITHTFLAAPFLALGVAAVAKLLFRRARFSTLYAWSLGALLIAHLGADVITYRGIRPLLPWSQWRLNYEIMPFIDLLFSGPLLIALGLGATLALAGRWLASRRERGGERRGVRLAPRRAAAAVFALWAIFYLGGRGIAWSTARSELAGGTAILTGFRTVSSSADGLRVRSVAFWTPWRVTERRLAHPAGTQVLVPVNPPGGSIIPARFLRVRYPHVVVSSSGSATRLTIVDLLAQYPLGSHWVELDGSGQAVRQGRSWVTFW